MKTASALSHPLDHTETMHALRSLLGGVWAKEKTLEAVAHLVQDNWNNGAFAWRRALSISLIFKRGANWLNTSEHKFRLLKWSARGRQDSGDKTRPRSKCPCSMKTNRCHFYVKQGAYLCYSQIKIWQKRNMTNDKKTSFSKREG